MNGVVDKPADIAHNAQWLRTMRDHLGWSTGQAARAIRAAAEQLEDKIDLSQQTVSAFENGQYKSNPRWLGYAQIAIIKELQRRDLDEAEAAQLRLPSASRWFFQGQRKRAGATIPQDDYLPARRPIEAGDDAGESVDDALTSEEREWIDLLRELEPHDREAVITLTRSLANSARGPTVHARAGAYRSAKSKAEARLR